MSVLIAALYLALLAGRAGAAHVVATRSTRRAAGRAPRREGWTRDVAILRPILSGDPDLGSVLADGLERLPRARHLWLVDASDAEAVALTRRLATAWPGRRIERRLLPEAPPGANPKTFKLEAGLGTSTERTVLVLDDDARLGPEALRTLVEALDDGAALATALPWHADTKGLAGGLLARFVNDNAAPTYLAPLLHLQPLSINGMCYAMRRGTLEAIGGFAPLLMHLTDDLALARALQAHGLPIVQTAAPVEVRTTLPTLAAYVRQLHRWCLFGILLVRVQSWPTRLLIGVLQVLPPLLLWALVIGAIGSAGASGPIALGVVLVGRLIVLAGVNRRFAGGSRARPPLSLLAELLQPLHLAHALLVRRIRWRTRRYRVRDVDDFVPL